MRLMFKKGMTMECDTCREWMSLWLDGRLVQAEIEQVEEHVATCPDCRTALDALRHVDRLRPVLRFVSRPGWQPAIAGGAPGQGSSPWGWPRWASYW
jgi:anti-sigma factor RsiW